MSEASEVDTSLGRVRGVEQEGVQRFLGIPYAAPPIGALRFEAPTPPKPWSGTLEAVDYGPAPPQTIDALSLELGLLADHVRSEDCLTINIFAPTRASGSPRPVMVWIHGGAFLTGTAAGPVYDGSRLAAEGEVVVVTFNYRVGALGFLALGAPNRGLQDQIAALRFVQAEIAAFGGDPGNVTVFGESAGAGSIVSLLAMPAARGLFHKAIVQSGAPEGMLSPGEAEDRARIFSQCLGVDPLDLGAHIACDIDAIVEAQMHCQEPGPRRIGMFFAPVIDGEVLPESPIEAISKGCARDIPLVIGTTAEEMQLYHLGDAFPEVPDALIPSAIAAGLPGPPEAALARAKELAKLYTGGEPALEGRDRFFAVQTDASLFVPATRLAEGHAGHQPKTWMYRFCLASPMQGGRLGACHALDIPFALGTTDRVPEFAGEGEGVDRVGRALRAAWTSFARAGDPRCDAVGDWRPYEPTHRTTLHFDDPCYLVDLPDEDRRRAWARARLEAGDD